jgi:NAD(P)H-hydrate repair Nnr-like enzyme with NAD(P)H-hydrate dehydratase domain
MLITSLLFSTKKKFNKLLVFKFTSETYNEKEAKYNSFESQCNAVKRLANSLENVTIMKKGSTDIISDGIELIYNKAEGSLKRCGGIGDILSGITATFSLWTHIGDKDTLIGYKPTLIAAYAASTLVKQCSHIAYLKYHRSLLATDIIEQIPITFHHTFESKVEN